MAHELQNANDMIYVGATPWHGLGEKVDSIDTLPRCLDWQVIKQSMSIHMPDGSLSKSGFISLLRSDSLAELGVATPAYNAHQNAMLWDTFKSFCDAGNMKIETAGTLKGGKIVWILARIEKEFTLSRGDDKQQLYALIATSHDCSMNTLAKPTIVRVVCWNTLSAALGNIERNSDRMNSAQGSEEGLFRMSHRGQYNMSNAKDFVARSILGFELFHEQAEKLIAVDLNGINAPIASAFTAELMNPSLFSEALYNVPSTEKLIDVSKEFGRIERQQLARIMAEKSESNAVKAFVAKCATDANKPMKELADSIRTEQSGIAGKTAWSLLQGATRYTDHVHGRTADSRLSNAWFGTGNNLKTKALNLALDYASALAA